MFGCKNTFSYLQHKPFANGDILQQNDEDKETEKVRKKEKGRKRKEERERKKEKGRKRKKERERKKEKGMLRQ
ncbi:hypothetical protein BgiBS90_005719 [Biomphalaria glabrata]|nr:hypothetical protein BgiBS90_005719 [Biomphalaria glabrata]